MYQCTASGNKPRGKHFLLESQQEIWIGGLFTAGSWPGVGNSPLLFLQDQCVVAPTGYCRGAVNTINMDTAPAQVVIPDHLHTLCWLGEWRSDNTVFNATSTLSNKLGARGVFPQSVVDVFGVGNRAATGIYVHMPAIGVLRQQGLLPLAEVFGVLVLIGCGNSKQHRVVCVWIFYSLSGGVPGNGLCDSAIPGRYGARLVTGTLGANRRQIRRWFGIANRRKKNGAQQRG